MVRTESKPGNKLIPLTDCQKSILSRVFLTGLLIIISIRLDAQPLYKAHNVVFDLFSTAPLEDIRAESTKGISALNISSGAVYFRVPIRSFEFKKGLMQEHFNENYLESSKYPYAEFKGNIRGHVKLSEEGTYPVTVEGDLKLHNVSQKYIVKAELRVEEGKLMANSTFPVKLADHHIKIPRLVIKNIAEVVQVTVSAKYEATATK